MPAYIQNLNQVVFSTKYRRPVLLKANRKRLYAYFWALFKKHNCHLYRVGGIEDHTHFIFKLHPSVAVADLVKNIKTESNKFIKREELFPDFTCWQVKYSWFTYAQEAQSNLVRYVANQEAHHRKENSKDELRRMLEEAGVKFKEEYLD